MDTLSGSVSTIKLPNVGGREFYHFKTAPNVPHHHQPQPQRHHLTSDTTKSNTISITPKFTTHHHSFPYYLFSSSSSRTSPLKLPPHTAHQKPASGYAAALLDIAQRNGALAAVERDVRRLSRLLRNRELRVFMNDNFMGIKEKGEVMKEVVEKGRFNGHLVGLVYMLVGKGKVGIVEEVMDECERIYDELSGIKRVVVISKSLGKEEKEEKKKKMEEEELFGIAQMMKRERGAVKVKVRHFIEETNSISLRMSSFAA
ncbi:hypothetical protein Ancab_038031 [Ancistrocladus abbreviatus]